MIRPPSGSPSRKLPHQRAEIRLPRKIIGAGEAGIEGDAGARGAACETARSGCRAPAPWASPSRRAKGWPRPPWRTQASGAACLHRGQKGVAHLRKQLHVLMAVDKVRRAAEQLAERRELRSDLGVDDLGIEPPQQAGAQQFRQAAGTCRRRAAGSACVSGLNGAVSVTCRPIAQRGLPAAAAFERADFVAADRAGPTTITEVALRRPRSIRSRIARLTPGLMP